MFKSSRRKIVYAIMSILVLLFMGTLAVIYASSYYEVSNRNFEMLERHAEMHKLSEFPAGEPLEEMSPDAMEPIPNNDRGGKHFENSPSFKLSTFYSVAVMDNGEVLATDIGDRESFEEELLKGYATEILEKGTVRGTKGNLLYLVAKKKGYTLVAFMDNTVMKESMTTLFRYTLVFGSVVLIALFFLAKYLAKRIVDPLEESYLKQKQFISDAGHELKTPVSVVSANAELLAREIGDNKWLDNIQYENEKMGNLVRELLELARTENVKTETVRLDLSRIVSGDILPFESVAFEKGIVLSTDVQNGISVMGDKIKLGQLVSILIDNAIRHCDEKREVSVSLSENRGSAVLSVVNSGETIPPEKLPHLFERFYRVDEAREDDGNSYGLGLAIAKAIVTSHKGKIEVRCYNGLVEFRVILPKS